MAEEQPAEEQLVTVRVMVPMSAGSMGYTAEPGDTLEVSADVANAWIDAGIAEPVAAPRASRAGDAPSEGAGATVEAPAPRVPRRNAGA
jgi:hypothetical protein